MTHADELYKLLGGDDIYPSYMETWNDGDVDCDLVRDATAELTRLRAEVCELTAGAEAMGYVIAEQAREISKLRAEAAKGAGDE